MGSNAAAAGNGKMKRSPARKSMTVAIYADDSKEPRLVGEAVVDLRKVLKECEHDGEPQCSGTLRPDARSHPRGQSLKLKFFEKNGTL